METSRSRPACLRSAALALALTGALTVAASAQTVVLHENNFPAIDTASLPAETLHNMSGAQLVNAADLPAALNQSATTLLVMPYGSAFPESDWPAILHFLQRGGNLLTLGGRPFTRPVYLTDGKWQPRPETYAFARQLFISDYQSTSASSGLRQLTNTDLAGEDMPAFAWNAAYSVVIRLSDEGSSTRIGASGTPDSDLRTLLWGVKDTRKVAAPIIDIDHFRNNFSGGRWIMLNCDPAPQGFPTNLLSRLASTANEGASQLTVTPTFPLYAAGELPSVDFAWTSLGPPPATKNTATITVSHDGKVEAEQSFTPQSGIDSAIALPGKSTYPPGFHTIVATLIIGPRKQTYRTGFWVRDEAYLLSGPHVTVDHDFFQIDGRQQPVVGTTYMDSKAQRLFLRYPNPYIWDEDMRQISQDGMNMLRTGLWTDWDVATNNTGIATEHTLRTIEAFLMTARRHNLPVQFNLFSFMPEVFGGGNPYLDPEALHREQAFVQSIVTRFHAVPFLVWDLMNEPSFDNPKRFFGTKPNGDAIESAEWNRWLLARYGSREAIASLWKMDLSEGAIPVPDEGDFYGGSAGKVLSVYDFNLFTQEEFTGWVHAMRHVIRNTGSTQLITVGTDEGGGLGSLSPTFFNTQVDFTTMHSWWLYDDLLWDSLVAKQAGKPMLVQETGVMFEPDLAGRPRRTLANEADLLSRKVGIALGTGAGAIEWLWNINSLMQSQQEVTIGAVRWDGTEKPEADILKLYAAFASAARDHFREPLPEDVTILTSQALQYSPVNTLATIAQQRSVRVMNYQCRQPARVVSENNAADIAGSKLVVLPSPQALSQSTWQALLAYVDHGGALLLTGPVDRDEHWQPVHRLADLGIAGEATALNFRGAQLDLGPQRLDLSFNIDAQKHAETLTIADGKTFIEIRRGTGQIFLVNTPIELAESPAATEAVYTYVLKAAAISAPFSVSATSPSVLIRPRLFDDATLYLLASESSSDEHLELLDKRSGAHLQLTLKAQQTRLVLLDLHGHILFSTGAPDPAH